MARPQQPDATASLTIAAQRLVAGDTAEPGWMRIEAGRIAELGSGRPASIDIDFGNATVTPGFVDMHVHGGGGGDYGSGDAASARIARRTHLEHGTTSSLASLVSAEQDALLEQIHALVPLVSDGLMDGIHLEGPWISKERKGAHDPVTLRPPVLAELREALEAGEGTVRMVTLAPELDGSMDAIRLLVEAGVVAAVGHTDASYDITRDAIAAGARVATHLFNAMRPLHHREPGPVLALLEDPRVTVELIADGTHLHAALHRDIVADIGSSRVALVTDAMSAATLGDGRYRLGTLEVDVIDGVALLRDGGSIAGSTVTMDVLYRTAVLAGGSDAPAFVSAAKQTATTPANAIGLDHVGSLAAGKLADFVVIDESLRVESVWKHGRAIDQRHTAPEGAPN